MQNQQQRKIGMKVPPGLRKPDCGSKSGDANKQDREVRFEIALPHEPNAQKEHRQVEQNPNVENRKKIVSQENCIESAEAQHGALQNARLDAIPPVAHGPVSHERHPLRSLARRGGVVQKVN